MRGPMITLVLVYALGMSGMALMPGPIVDGTTSHMSFFHAFYFMAYSATTTGFGELPVEFSEPQRMWAIICLYMSVVAWIYAIGSLIRLLQNPFFTQAVSQRRFAKAAERIHDPFVIICGFGDTGSLLTRGLSDRGITGVIIDADQERIRALALRDYVTTMPGLCADASVPKNLQDAGIAKSNCVAVVVLTDEKQSLKIAVMTRLLNPQARIICRSTSRQHDAELASLGSVVVTDPFESFARELSFAMSRPALHTLDEWLVGARVNLRDPAPCPRGRWVLCGYGRMGSWLLKSLDVLKIQTTVIDPVIDQVVSQDSQRFVQGAATSDNLKLADLAHCAGIIAGTDSDADNLAILLAARSIKPDLYLVVRQNHHENELAFQAVKADLIMQPSLVTARRILLNLISPLLQPFLEHMENHPTVLLEEVYPRLLEIFDDEVPWLWTVHVDQQSAPALINELQSHDVTLGLVLAQPANPSQTISCVPLIMRRGSSLMVLPGADQRLEIGDEILMCGHSHTEHILTASLTSPYTLSYLRNGVEPPRSRILAKFR
ncbi:MAG: voltage-gated potassium channel [Limisphaerales bacterium]|jgi:voltage-gated potassium channel